MSRPCSMQVRLGSRQRGCLSDWKMRSPSWFDEWRVERSHRRRQRRKERENRPRHPLMAWIRDLGKRDRDNERRTVAQSATQPENSLRTEVQASRLDALEEFIQLCSERADAEEMEKVLHEAVAKDHLFILVWAHVQGMGGWSSSLMDLAAELGLLHIVKWLHSYRFMGCTTAAMDAAAGNGRLDIVKWLHRHRHEGCTTEAMDRAVTNGHFEMVKFLHEERREGCTVEAFETAIKRRDMEMVKFLYDRRPELLKWPQPENSTILKDLLLSWYPVDKGILDYITSRRQERYLPLEHSEPADYDEQQELKEHEKPQSGIIYGLGQVMVVLNRKVPHFYWEHIGSIITQYLIRDPRTFTHPIEAANNGYVYWLAQYGPLGSGHLRWLARRGQFDEARRMHEFRTNLMLKQECDDHFKLLLMEQGDLTYIKWHIRNCRSMQLDEVVHLAVWMGRTDVIRWIQAHYKGWKKSISGGARWKVEPSTTKMDNAAAENNFAEVMELHAAQEDDAICTTRAMDLAAANGHLEMVQWLSRYRSEGCTTDAMDLAASNGHLEVLKWLRRYRGEGCTSLAMDGAAANGHLHVIRWLCQSRRTKSTELNQATLGLWQDEEHRGLTFHGSVRSHVENVRSIRHSPLDLAACYGHLDVVKFLHEHHDSRTIAFHAMDLAAANGHLQVVRYLHQSRRGGCTDVAIYGALENKHYGVVLYLYKHQAGCRRWPKDEDLLSTVLAILAGPITPAAMDLLCFFRTRRKFRLEPAVMDKASSEGNLEVVSTIHDLDLGDCTTAAMDSAAEAGHLDVVRFLHENRSEGCSLMALNHAVHNGHESTVRFLNEHRNEGCSPYAMSWATRNNHIGVVRYMLEAGMPGDVQLCQTEAASMHNNAMIQVLTTIYPTNKCRQKDSTRKRTRHYFLSRVFRRRRIWARLAPRLLSVLRISTLRFGGQNVP